MASVDNDLSWMPPAGRHHVNIGSSLNRHLKARKNKDVAPANNAKRSNLPERYFHSVRYNFRPKSVDPERPGSIEIKKVADNSLVTAEFPSVNEKEVIAFKGGETAATDIECVLIFDEDTGTYTLEKMDSFINLSFQKTMQSSRPVRTASPSPSLATTSSRKAESSSSKGKTKLEDDLERELLGELEEDGEVVSHSRPSKHTHYKEEEEEEDPDEELLSLARASPQPRKPPSPPTKPVRPVKELPKPRVETKPTNPVARASSPVTKATNKTPRPSNAGTVPSKAYPSSSLSAPAKPSPLSASVTAPSTKPRPVPPSSSKAAPNGESIPAKRPPKREADALPTLSRQKPKTSDQHETVDMPKPPPAKKARVSVPQRKPSPPPPPKPVALALPGGSGTIAPLPALPGASRQTPNSATRKAPLPVVTAVPPIAAPVGLALPGGAGQESDEDEDDWEAVVDEGAKAPVSQRQPPVGFNIVMEEEDPSLTNPRRSTPLEEEEEMVDADMFGSDLEEEDADMLEQELNAGFEELEEQDLDQEQDFLEEALAETPVRNGPIMSLNAFVGGTDIGVSEDDYSSSDDSDED